MKKAVFTFSLILLAGVLGACGSSSADSGALDEDKLVVGATAGPHEQVLEVVREVAAEDGLEIEIVSFSDFVLPNTSLDEGDLDANTYQHQPFLDEFNEDHGTDLVSVGTTILNPMGVYSDEYEDINDLPDGAIFAVPNDPTNASRALFILEEAGIVGLDEETRENASIYDLAENPKNLEFIELEASQMPQQLSEVDAAAITTNFAIGAGISPKDDSILLEAPNSPYANNIVVRQENADDPTIERFVNAYHTDKVKEFVEEEFEGSIIPTWDE